MKMLNKIEKQTLVLTFEGHSLKYCSEKSLFLPVVFFLINNFESILDYPHLVLMLLTKQ